MREEIRIGEEMETVGLCMIVKNEDNYLERCLESVSDLVDEVIIVDTGSTDGTKEIAKRYTEKIYEKTFTGDFSEMRNFALKFCKTDWILFLDADEFFSKKDLKLLKELLMQGIPKEYGGIKFYVYNFFNTGGWYTGHVLRMFRNYKNFEYRRPFGERIEPSVIEKGYGILEPNIILNHTGHSKSPKYRYSKTEKYLNICREQIANGTADSLVYSYLGINAKNNGNLALAYEMTKKGIENNPFSFLSHCFYGTILRLMNENEQAIQEYEKAEKLAPTVMKGIMKNNIGVIHLSVGNFEVALGIFNGIIENFPHLVHVKLNMGLTYYFMEQYGKALWCFEEVIERNPYFNVVDNKAFLECEPWKSLSYETIYGYFGLQYFIDECCRKLGVENIHEPISNTSF